MNNISKIKIDLTGKTTLITGGTRGIGKAIADKFTDSGASVIITGTKKEEIERLNKENTTKQKKYLRVDFSDENSTEAFIGNLPLFGKIDVLVNNAGVNKVALNEATSLEDYKLLNDVNLKAPYLLCREVSKMMKKEKFGRIVNISSIWSIITRPGRSIYTITKCGLVGLTKALSVELAPENILVNAVSPGFTMTELTATTNTKEEIEQLSDIIPIRRFADPKEIANLVLFLVSDLNTYITGQNIIIDGGYCNV
jgi:3-oxoacyl-[acyl-carrier protein] reductase